MTETPCTRVCTLDPSFGLCLGCGRSREEIGRWTLYSASERRAIMATLRQRLDQIANAPMSGRLRAVETPGSA